MHVTAALDTAPEFGAALRDLWQSLSVADRRRPLLLVAHGPEHDDDAALWMSALGRFAADIAKEGGVPAAVGLLRDDAEPSVRAGSVRAMRESVTAMIEQGADSVTVLPVLIASSGISRVTIPKDLAELPVSYHRVALATSPFVSRWIERVAREALAAPAQ